MDKQKNKCKDCMVLHSPNNCPNRRVQGITSRVKIKDEKWFLRIKGDNVLEFNTKTKKERNTLSAIRKMLIAYDIKDVDLTNRVKYIKNLNVSQDKLMKMKANDRFPIMQEVKREKEY